MTIEQKLAAAFDAAGRFEPSPDLWQRVTHSIDEDDAHRRRVRSAVFGVIAALAAVAVVLTFSIDNGGRRPRLDWRAVEIVEAVTLAMLVVVLGPAIRRFGKGYAHDLFRVTPAAADHLLGVLDIAYYLVFAAYVLVTTRLSAPLAYQLFDVSDQLEQATARIGGLLLMMGVLHAITFMLLPLLSLVVNSTRVGTKLPRWVSFVLVLMGIQAAVMLPMILGSVIGIGGGE